MRINLRKLAGAVAVAALATAPDVASAQANTRALGWNVLLTGTCMVGCTQYRVDFELVDLQPTDNKGAATPAAILALGSNSAYGFIQSVSLRFGGLGTVVPGTISAVPPALTASSPNSQQINLLDLGGFTTGTYSAGRVFSVEFDVAGGPIEIVSAEGFAYLDNKARFYRSNGTVIGANPTLDGNPSYVGGDFSIAVNTVPEPATVALMGTGLLAVLGAGAVRRRTTA